MKISLKIAVPRILLTSKIFYSKISQYVRKNRSSRPEVFCKKGVLRNFTKFAGKHLFQNLFLNKVADQGPATLFRKRLWHRCFPANLAKFLRTSFIIEHLWWLFLKIFTISAVQVFNPKPISTVVLFSRIFLYIKAGLYDEIFLSQVVKCFFRQFPFNI